MAAPAKTNGAKTNGTAAPAALPVAAPGAEVVVNSVGKTFRRGGRRTVALAGVGLKGPGRRASLPARPVRLR